MLPPLDRIGHYDLEREIGRGGMGIVYLARDRANGRLVALKVISASAEPGHLKRFRREAATLSDVRIPNVVPAFESGEADGICFLAMRYIPGTPLEAMVRARRVSRPTDEPEWVFRSVRIVEKLARALHELHRHGIVHRDIKPENVLVDHWGDPWLVDFGLVQEDDGETTSGDDVIVGTVQYIAPEQIDGGRGPADHRVDLYSLGVTLYELLTLRRPFAGLGTSAALLAIAREQPPSPRSINPALSEDLERVILRAMAKDPARRYQTGEELAEDLKRVRTFKPLEPGHGPRWARIIHACVHRPRIAAAALFGVLCFVGALEWGVYRKLADERLLEACREEADVAFAQGRIEDASRGYSRYLELGGRDAGVSGKLTRCKRRAASDSALGDRR